MIICYIYKVFNGFRFGRVFGVVISYLAGRTARRVWLKLHGSVSPRLVDPTIRLTHGGKEAMMSQFHFQSHVVGLAIYKNIYIYIPICYKQLIRS